MNPEITVPLTLQIIVTVGASFFVIAILLFIIAGCSSFTCRTCLKEFENEDELMKHEAEHIYNDQPEW